MMKAEAALRELVDAMQPLIEQLDHGSHDRYLRSLGRLKTLRIRMAYRAAAVAVTSPGTSQSHQPPSS